MSDLSAILPSSPPTAVVGTGRRHAIAVTGCLTLALACLPLAERIDIANISMLFLLLVVLLSVWLGRGPGVLSACLSVLIVDIAFVPPRWTIAVSDVQYLLTLIVMLAVALITASLTAGLKQQVEIAAGRERDTRALYDGARDLAGAVSARQTSATIQAVTQTLFDTDAVLLLPDLDERLRNADPERPNPPWVDTSVADVVYREAAGRAGADVGGLPLSERTVHYRALRAPMRVRGVLAVRGPIGAERLPLLDALSSLTAIAVERLHYVDVAQRTQLQMNTERLRHSLLAAVSHDLRTPLTALVGLADTLTLPGASLNARARETAEAIRDQAREMSSQVSNLLDMARLQTGRITLRREWQPIDEVIGSSLHQLRQPLEGRRVDIDIAPDLPLVDIDAVLIERVLCNLLDNAAKYSPASASITIAVRRQDGSLVVAVKDSGPGVPPADARRIFEVFERAGPETSAVGVGLGLSIARGIVEAHGGTLRLVEQPHGACFEFTIPIGNPPSIDADRAS